jgi:hypothetical protein
MPAMWMLAMACALAAAIPRETWAAELAAAPANAAGVRTIHSLAGPWRCRDDRGNVGVQEAWHKTRLDKTATLPGTGAIVVWYQRDLDVPDDWKGKRIELTLGRSRVTQVWVNDRFVGMRNGLSTEQTYDLSEALPPGQHVLTIRVSRDELPQDIGGHEVHGLQGGWVGILGRVDLTVSEPVWIESLKVLPDMAQKRARVEIAVGNRTGKAASGQIELSAQSWNTPRRHVVPPVAVDVTTETGGGRATAVIDMGPDVQLWDEFSPALYKLTGQLRTATGQDQLQTDFGMRQFTVKGTQFQINGQTIFLRGTHNACGNFPLTGYPSLERDEWVRIFRISKAWGLNHYRFHSWCPPRAAFEAADIVGIYMQPELPHGLSRPFGNKSEPADARSALRGIYVDTTAAERPTSPGLQSHDDYCRDEGLRILSAYGNSPSLVMFALANETPHSPSDLEVQNRLIGAFREAHPGLVAASCSNPESYAFNTQDDYWTTQLVKVGHHGRPNANDPASRVEPIRGSFCYFSPEWPGVPQMGAINALPPNENADYSKAVAMAPRPLISHEVGQYAVFPDFRLIGRYRPTYSGHYQKYREALQAKGMLDQADSFFDASARWSGLCYRRDVEAALRTPGFGGFQLLDLIDFEGQGGSLVGLLNTFMEAKDPHIAATWRQWCGEVVPLARFEKYAWTTAERFVAMIDLSNYGSVAMTGAELSWRLDDGQGRTLASGVLKGDAPRGGLSPLGKVDIPLDTVAAPQRVELTLALQGTEYRNSYPLWVYPAKQETVVSAAVKVVRRLDAGTLAELQDGGRVVFFPELESLETVGVPAAFIPDFWNSNMFFNNPGTYGILCDPKHPALEKFPTEFHSNQQWWPIATHARPVILDDTEAAYRPIVQVIDTFARNHKLGLIFEAKVGQGRLLVCAADLPNHLEDPAVRQLHASLLAYAGSERFDPKAEWTPDLLNRLLPTPIATAAATRPDKDAEVWLVDFGKSVAAGGCALAWKHGLAHQYVLEGSLDQKTWTKLAEVPKPTREATGRHWFPRLELRYLRMTSTYPAKPSWESYGLTKAVLWDEPKK